MSIKLSEEKYKELKKLAAQEHKKLNVENMTTAEKEEVIQNHVNSKKFDNDEMREIFIANFLIPDDQKFYQTYMSNGKSIKKSAEVLNVPEKVVFTRVFELGKYSSYISLKHKKGEEKMKEIEIIDGFNLATGEKEENIVDDSAMQAIAKINMLIEGNDSKDKTIENQITTINKLNEEIENLHYVNNEQNDQINALLIEKSNLENKNKELEAIILSKENEIEKMKLEKATLMKYKENYEKIIGFLAKNENKGQKK
jgi:hypothetical protein